MFDNLRHGNYVMHLNVQTFFRVLRITQIKKKMSILRSRSDNGVFKTQTVNDCMGKVLPQKFSLETWTYVEDFHRRSACFLLGENFVNSLEN
jgi:uncharacterized protein involved in type VI secretion and phage assembly